MYINVVSDPHEHVLLHDQLWLLPCTTTNMYYYMTSKKSLLLLLVSTHIIYQNDKENQMSNRGSLVFVRI